MALEPPPPPRPLVLVFNLCLWCVNVFVGTRGGQWFLFCFVFEIGFLLGPGLAAD